VPAYPGCPGKRPLNGCSSFQDNLGKPAADRLTSLNFNEARDNGVGVASAGSYANYVTLLQTDSHASTSPLNFYRLNTIPDAQPTVS